MVVYFRNASNKLFPSEHITYPVFFSFVTDYKMETEAYEQKLKAIQAYLPILEKHIYRNVDGKKEAPIDVKLKTLHAMITSKDKKYVNIYIFSHN